MGPQVARELALERRQRRRVALQQIIQKLHEHGRRRHAVGVARAAELARAAYRACGIEPLSVPIRGGTDGSRLTEMGVPTPNLFTGMQDIHGPLEWISVQDMEAAAGVCLKLAELGAGG